MMSFSNYAKNLTDVYIKIYISYVRKLLQNYKFYLLKNLHSDRVATEII